MQIDIYSAENEGQRYQNTLLMGRTLDDLGNLLDDALGLLQRRTLDTSWFCGKVLGKAKEDAGHGQWIPWLSARGISHSTAKRLMLLYSAYPQIDQIGLFESVDSALKALAPKPEPKQIEHPEPQPEPKQFEQDKDNPRVWNEVVKPDPATTEPLTAFDTVTGKETEWPEDKQPTAEEQLTAQAQRGTELEPLKAQDLKKTKVDSTTTKLLNHLLLETMHRNMKYRAEENGCEVLERLRPDDYVVITARDIWCIANGYPLQGVNGDQAIFQKGEVIR